jgi:transaldolase
MLGGGARGTHHFTEFVGGDLHVTMNWSTIRELNDLDGEVTSRIDAEDPPDLVDELMEKLPDFRRAYLDDGLGAGEFEGFAPLQRFRSMFVEGCRALHEAVRSRRAKG